MAGDPTLPTLVPPPRPSPPEKHPEADKNGRCISAKVTVTRVRQDPGGEVDVQNDNLKG